MNKLNYIFAVLIITLLISCKSDKYEILEGYAQGTTFRIVYNSSNSYNIDIYKMLKEFDMALSTYEDSSIISLINKNDPNVTVNKLFTDFFNESKTAYEKSNGYFDVTVGPLVNAWGFGVTKEFRSDSSSIDSIMKFVGMDKIKIENNKLIKSDSRIYIDGNAIAQGQSVDFIASLFEKEGLANYMIEIGGEVRAKGVNEEGIPWQIGIDKPIENINDRELQAIVSLSNKAMATSGNYRKFYELNGIKYAHSINPKTGYPARDILLSATIIADECAMADAYATACMVMGYEKAKKFIESNKDLEAYFIVSGKDGKYEIYQSDGFKKYLSKE